MIKGVSVSPLSAYYVGDGGREGLLVGYTGVPEDETRLGLNRLLEAARELGARE